MKKQKMNIRINKQLQMICDTLDTTPEAVLQEFADNLSLDYRYTSGGDERRMAVEYFMRCSYGMHLFDFDEIETMFDMLNGIRCQFYNYGNPKEKEYQEERNKQYSELKKEWDKQKKDKLKKQGE